MNPKIALMLCVVFIIIVFWVDHKRSPNMSNEMWIVLIWMMIIGSRNISYWLDLGGADNIMDGSPYDRVIFFVFNIAGVYILYKRDILLFEITRKNVFISMYFLYALMSIFWSEIPFVAIKRLFKTIGVPVMALVILSEPNPVEAIKIVFRRCAYVLLPLSIICNKYYPNTGRQYTHSSGEIMYRGVTGQKNELGLICMIFGIIFIWCLINIKEKKDEYSDNGEYFLYLLFLFISLWLLHISNSATSLVCFIIGAIILISSKIPIIKNKPQKLISGIFWVSTVLFIVGYLFNIKQELIAALGRDSTLTTRIPIWDFLMGFNTSSIFGAGFESFWTDKRMELAYEYFGTHSAHNGYLDIYLNLGFVGLLIFAAIIINTINNIRKMSLKYNYDFYAFRITFVVVILLYSYTEAYLSGLNLIYFMFFLVSVECLPTNNSGKPKQLSDMYNF